MKLFADSATMMETVAARINSQMAEHRILLYMKGTPLQPQCGFSARAVQALIDCGQPFAYVDILADQEVRTALPGISDWPTFPQLFVAGELIGGSDIVDEMHQSGELSTLLESLPTESGDD